MIKLNNVFIINIVYFVEKIETYFISKVIYYKFNFYLFINKN